MKFGGIYYICGMKKVLEENKGVPLSLLWTLAGIAGISVANLYYNQPLLNRISEDLGVSEFTANLIPMTTQIGYALGLLFIIPLGDLCKRQHIIIVNFLLLAVSMLGFGMANHIGYYRNMFGDAADLHSDSRTVFRAAQKGTERRHHCQRTAYRYPGLTGGERYRR